jgi:hypothetical protein
MYKQWNIPNTSLTRRSTPLSPVAGRCAIKPRSAGHLYVGAHVATRGASPTTTCMARCLRSHSRRRLHALALTSWCFPLHASQLVRGQPHQSLCSRLSRHADARERGVRASALVQAGSARCHTCPASVVPAIPQAHCCIRSLLAIGSVHTGPSTCFSACRRPSMYWPHS